MPHSKHILAILMASAAFSACMDDVEPIEETDVPIVELDSDGDGVGDNADAFPNDPERFETTPAYTPLNDTGITTCGDYVDGGGSGNDDNNLDCAAAGSTQTNGGTDADGDPVPAGQDAVYGRDATHNDNSDGHAGFSFTKLDANGDALAASAASWACVQDNVTGLVWEVKTDDGGLQDKDNTYTWYNSTGVNTGGSAGTAIGGVCTGGSGCDTEKYVVDVNATNLCGANDWRLPTIAEFSNIASRDRINPAIDTDYFPNTMNGRHWASSPYASDNNYAWFVDFNDGGESVSSKNLKSRVRLVRASQ